MMAALMPPLVSLASMISGMAPVLQSLAARGWHIDPNRGELNAMACEMLVLGWACRNML